MSPAWRWGGVSIDTVQVETTSDCNLKCQGCLRTLRLAHRGWTSRHMPADLFARVLDHLPICRVLILNGTGEPMLNPDISAIVRMARDSGKFQGLTFNSNGLARDIPAFVEVAKAGLSFLSVSVDSLTQAVADKVRGGTRVDKLAKRVRELAAALPIPLTITTVVCRENLLDVGETLAQLNGLGRFTVFLTGWSDVALLDFLAHDRLTPSHPSDTELNVNRSLKQTSRADSRLQSKPDNGFDFRRSALEPMGRALEQKDRIFLAALVEKMRPQLPNLDLVLTQPVEKSGERCPAPFRHPFVNAEGFLAPCCTLTDAYHYGGISIAEIPLIEAMRLPVPARWLEGYALAEPLACRGCQHAVRQ